MRRSSLWNLVFLVVLVVAFLWVRYYKEETSSVLLKEFGLFSPSGKALGKVSFFERKDRSRFVRIKLVESLPEPSYVILYERQGLGYTLGKVSGTTFLRSISPRFRLEELSKIVIKGAKSGLIYAEASLKFEG